MVESSKILRKRCRYWLGLASSLSILFCVATENVGAQTAPEAAEGIVKAQTAQGFTYESGGVGIEERAQMAQARDYSLKLMFANGRGQYLANVNVVIRDQSGKEIVSSITNGPWFYIKLPPGKYSVEASFDGKTKREAGLNVGNSQQVVRLFEWS